MIASPRGYHSDFQASIVLSLNICPQEEGRGEKEAGSSEVLDMKKKKKLKTHTGSEVKMAQVLRKMLTEIYYVPYFDLRPYKNALC